MKLLGISPVLGSKLPKSIVVLPPFGHGVVVILYLTPDESIFEFVTELDAVLLAEYNDERAVFASASLFIFPDEVLPLLGWAVLSVLLEESLLPPHEIRSRLIAVTSEVDLSVFIMTIPSIINKVNKK